ncbi:MAG: hypothetical protein U0002_04405 [Thermoanaerobaculia bacterium]
MLSARGPELVVDCDPRGRILTVTGSELGLASRFLVGDTLAASVAEAATSRLLDLLFRARLEGAAVASDVAFFEEGERFSLEMAALRTAQGLMLAAHRDPEGLRRALLEPEFSSSLTGAAHEDRERLSELLGGGRAIETLPTWSREGLVRLLAEKNREIANLKAELGRLRSERGSAAR